MQTPIDMIYSSSTNLVDAVIDEVALEGLDGITLEALWQRMAIRLQINFPLTPSMMEQIWLICISTRELLFYELETPRAPLIIFDRYKFVDPDLGTILEPDVVPEDIYEHFPIDDTKKGVRGSCKSYDKRKPIDSIKSLSCAAANEKYGQKLVIVGSQKAREYALLGDTICPSLELTLMQHCFLERVGRSRYHGEITQGKRSLSIMREDPKTLFYHRKYLLKHRLITKQAHHQKHGGHCSSGSLLHLPRFFVERKPKMIYLAERIIEILKTRENYLSDYGEIKKMLQIDGPIRKLFKMAFFQKYVKTDVQIPYRTLYPQADEAEWQTKSNGKEKIIRAIQLIDPSTDVNELWSKDEVLDDEEVYDVDISKQKVNVPLLRQANMYVEDAAFNGLSQTELGSKLGTTKLQSRTIFRNMQKYNIVGTYMNDMGRQRVTKYVSRKFEKNSSISKQFQTEKSKMKEFTKVDANNDIQESRPLEVTPLNTQPSVTEQQNEESIPVATEEIENSPKMSKSELHVLFSATNRLLKKYKLNKNIPKYCVAYRGTILNDIKTSMKCRWKKLPNKTKVNCNVNENKSSGEPEQMSDIDSCNVCLQETSIVEGKKGEFRSLLQDLNLNEGQNHGNVTYRILRRANLIIAAVKMHKIIDDMTKLIKLINEEEEREGYDVKIDKKSLIRLLEKLSVDKLVKNIKVTLTTKDGKKKGLTFICDPSIGIDHTAIQSAVEQAKLKFCVLKPQKFKPTDHEQELNATKVSPLKRSPRKKMKMDMTTEKPVKLHYNAKIGRRFGYSPKFIRLQIIHILAYYMIYDHPGTAIPRAQQIQRLRASGYQIDEKTEKSMGTIYNTEVNWKMFIPPLPVHIGWPTGWALVCDILLRLPLSIFVKIHKLPFVVPDLDYYIEHPIRKHFLVKDLPVAVRNVLLHKRKYVYDVHETLSRLCYLGLVQFGPQKLKEKEQVFFYLNRRSSLMDTTNSAAGYHMIEDKEYPLQHYCFDKLQVVEKYWYDMWNICINTPLGGRLAVQGTDIVLEDATKKLEMVATLKARLPREAPDLDTGHMPGNKRGAAGIDSALFPHLKRNWNWENFHSSSSPLVDHEKPMVIQRARSSHLSKIEARPLKFTEFHGLKAVTGPTTLDASELKGAKVQKSQLPTSTERPLKHKVSSPNRTKQSTIVRRVLPRKVKARSKVKYDDIDYSALQKMEKLRVDWDAREDNILLVCRVVMSYLCPNPRRQLVSFTAVRDVLRSYSINSHNKTSRACQRRLLYMLKQPQTSHSVGLGVEELKQNYYLHKRYGDIVDRIRRQTDTTRFYEKITEIFKNLVSYVAKKYYDISKQKLKGDDKGSGEQAQVEGRAEIEEANDDEEEEEEDMPQTLQEFNLLYETSHPQKPGSHLGFTHDVRNVNDIHTATINSVIYSSMCCGKDRRSWAYQLFKIYQQYSELLLRNAMGKIRADQMVSVKKHYINAIKKFGNCMPMSSSQYQLSSAYIYKFHTKMPAEAYGESFDFLMKIIDSHEADNLGVAGGIEVVPPTGGMIAGICDYLAESSIDFNIEIPDHIITLDPKLQEYDETYMKLATRYQDILTSLTSTEVTDEPSVPTISNESPSIPATSMEIEDTTPEVEAETACPEAKTSMTSKKSLPKIHWTQTMPRKQTTVEEGFDTLLDSENLAVEDDKLDDDYDNDYIRLQDGTIITITKDDISSAKFNPINASIHEAFVNTRIEQVEDDMIPFNAIDKLKCIITEYQTCRMEIEETSTPMEVVSEMNESDDCLEFSGSSSESTNNSNLINDIIANMRCEFEVKSTLHPKERDPGEAKRCHTRLALLKMREELNDDLPDSHHAHDYFVVNTFGIFYSFPRLKLLKDENSKLTNELIKSSGYLMLEDEVHKKILDDLRKFAVFPREFPEHEVMILIDGFKKEYTSMVYKYVESKQEQGATMPELVSMFYRKFSIELYEILDFLVDNRLFLRSGVTEVHYIHHHFVDPWLIHSMRILRLQKESLPPVPYNAVYVLNTDEQNNAEDAKESTQNTSSAENNQQNEDKLAMLNDQQKNLQKKRTCLLQSSEIYSAAKKLDMNSAEDIKVVVRPWIQIDGLINRKSLEQMLGSILGHCMFYPGISLSHVQERFIPALQPYHTRELVEILIKLGCLEIKVLQKGPSNLFTSSIEVNLNHPLKKNGEAEYDNEIILEPTIGAVVRFSLFLRKSHDQLH